MEEGGRKGGREGRNEQRIKSVPKSATSAVGQIPTLVKAVTKLPKPCSSTEWFDLGQDFVSLILIFLISKRTMKPIVFPSVLLT